MDWKTIWMDCSLFWWCWHGSIVSLWGKQWDAVWVAPASRCVSRQSHYFSVECAVLWTSVLSPAHRTTAERESGRFRDETIPDYSAVLPRRPSTILCSEVSLVRHIFKLYYASHGGLCGRICACREKSCTLQNVAWGGRVLLARQSVSLAFWKVPEPSEITGGINWLHHSVLWVLPSCSEGFPSL